jgi:hypothetical protein
VRRAAILATAVLAGCGGASSPKHPAPVPARTQRTIPPDPNANLRLPAHVPRRAHGTADAASVRVIDRWLRTLRRGDEFGAARFWATGSKFQNATPVLTIDTPIEKVAIQKSLPCGARIKYAAGPAPFVVLVFTLTRRPGGDCGTAVGQTARGAIRVDHGLIVEWYRLPDDPSQEQPDGASPSASGPAA